MVEAVTSRVSALPAVGSDIRISLSAAAGGEDRLWLGSGDILDKVGHGAGRSDARMVPVEHLSSFGEYCALLDVAGGRPYQSVVLIRRRGRCGNAPTH